MKVGTLMKKINIFLDSIFVFLQFCYFVFFLIIIIDIIPFFTKKTLEENYYIFSIIGVLFIISSTFVAFYQVHHNRKSDLRDTKLDIYLDCEEFALYETINGDCRYNFDDLNKLYKKIKKGQLLYNSSSEIVAFFENILTVVEQRKNSFINSSVNTSTASTKYALATNEPNSLKDNFLNVKKSFNKELRL